MLSFEETAASIALPRDKNTGSIPPLAGFNSATSAVVPIGVILLPDGTYAVKTTAGAGTATATMVAPVTVTEAATLVLAANTARRGHVLFNSGLQTLYVGVANTITTATGIPVAPGAEFDLDARGVAYTGAIYGITAAGVTTSVRGVIYA